MGEGDSLRYVGWREIASLHWLKKSEGFDEADKIEEPTSGVDRW